VLTCYRRESEGWSGDTKVTLFYLPWQSGGRRAWKGRSAAHFMTFQLRTRFFQLSFPHKSALHVSSRKLIFGCFTASQYFCCLIFRSLFRNMSTKALRFSFALNLNHSEEMLMLAVVAFQQSQGTCTLTNRLYPAQSQFSVLFLLCE
jgi:hypothetical protein